MNFYPKDFGTVGAGNDTAAIQGAIDAIRQDGGGKLILDRAEGFVTDCLNATYCSNLEIVADLGCIVTASVTHQAPLIDLCKSHNFRADCLVITLPEPFKPVTYPKAAFLLHGGDKYTFNNLTVNGTASSALICAVGASSATMRDCQLIQWDPSAPTVSLSTEADWGISSMFYSGTLSEINMPDWYFAQTEIHQLGGGQWTFYGRNVDHITFRDGLSSNNQRAHYLFQGNNAHCTFDSVKYYCEVGGAAQMVMEADGVCHGFRVDGPSRDGIPTLKGGSGSWPYFDVSPAQS